MKIVIACDIHKEDEPYKSQAYELYEKIENSGIAQPYFYSDNNKIFRKKPYFDYRNIEDVTSIKNSIIILMSEINEFYKIDDSNKIAYFNNRNKLDKFAIFMLNKIDCILADDYKSAIALCNETTRFNADLPIYRFPVHFQDGKFKNTDSDIVSVAMFGGNEKKEQSINFRNNLNLVKVSNINEVKNSKIVVVESDVDSNSLRNMMNNSVVVIAPNRLPYTEYIIDGFNGFLVSNDSKFEKSIELCSRNLAEYQDNIKKSAALVNDDREFVTDLINTVNGAGVEDLRDNFRFNRKPKEIKNFIIRDQVMGDGKVIPFPPTFDHSNYNELTAHDLIELLELLVSIEFDEVVVFSNNIAIDMNKIEYLEKLSAAIGRRGINIFWCGKSDLDSRLNKTFKYINVMNTLEGIKRVIK